MTRPTNYSIEDCARAADKLIANGASVYQKFTCANCGARQTMSEKNKFFTSGTCEECGHVTDIQKYGCNYLVHYQLGEAS